SEAAKLHHQNHEDAELAHQQTPSIPHVHQNEKIATTNETISLDEAFEEEIRQGNLKHVLSQSSNHPRKSNSLKSLVILPKQQQKGVLSRIGSAAESTLKILKRPLASPEKSIKPHRDKRRSPGEYMESIASTADDGSSFAPRSSNHSSRNE